MRTRKRSIFNMIFQPWLIGSQIRRKGIRTIKRRLIKRTAMQKHRRANVGSRNLRINKHAIISRLKLIRTFNLVRRGSSSIFVKRARS